MKGDHKSKHTPESLITEMTEWGVKLDQSLHETLGKDAIPALQNIMESNIIRSSGGLPERFKLLGGSHGSRRIIKDTQTGNTLEVGLCDLSGAIKALNTFLP